MTTRDIARRAAAAETAQPRRRAPRTVVRVSCSAVAPRHSRRQHDSAPQKYFSESKNITQSLFYWLYQKIQLKFQDRQCIDII